VTASSTNVSKTPALTLTVPTTVETASIPDAGIPDDGPFDGARLVELS